MLSALALAALPLAAGAATSSPNDPAFQQGQQWGLSGAPASINAPAAWCVSTGAGITVGDIDTGADMNHPDLATKVSAGARFTSGRATGPGSPDAEGGSAVQDGYGHGSLTTGIAGAATNNGTGIAGVAPDARMLIVKVLDDAGKGFASDVKYGMEWAVDHGAQVLNVSIGSEVPLVGNLPGQNALADGIDYAAQRGVAVAVAAGNSSLPLNDYTLLGHIQQEALIVGALTRSGGLASYSNAGANVYAPGGDGSGTSAGDILSTDKGGGYASGAGTSFATPHVAGVLALLMSRGMSAQAAHDTILSHLRSGRQLDAAAALGVGPNTTCSASGSAPPPGNGATLPPGRSGGGAGGAAGGNTPGHATAGTAPSPGGQTGTAARAGTTPGSTPSGGAAHGGTALNPASSPTPGASHTQPFLIVSKGALSSPFLVAAGGFAMLSGAATYLWLRQTGRL